MAIEETIAALENVEARAAIADRFHAWAAETPGAAPLAEEWIDSAIRDGKDDAVALLTRLEEGKTVYAVACANGYHESYESHVAALRDMVEAHR